MIFADATRGDPEPFARQDAIEAAWRIVDPVLHDAIDPQNYDTGSWGPPGAERLAADIGGWRAPSPVTGMPGTASPRQQPTPHLLADEIDIAT